MFAIFFFKRNSSSVVRATYIFKITIAGQLRVTPQLTKPWVAGSNPACFAKIGAVNVKITKWSIYIYFIGYAGSNPACPTNNFINEVKSVLLLNWKKKLTITFLKQKNESIN